MKKALSWDRAIFVFWRRRVQVVVKCAPEAYGTSRCNRMRAGGWATAERIPSGGQQLWREGEGSGLWAGEAPAGTPTAAREHPPVRARGGWLKDTVQPKGATIGTTPRDRLAITG